MVQNNLEISSRCYSPVHLLCFPIPIFLYLFCEIVWQKYVCVALAGDRWSGRQLAVLLKGFVWRFIGSQSSPSSHTSDLSSMSVSTWWVLNTCHLLCMCLCVYSNLVADKWIYKVMVFFFQNIFFSTLNQVFKVSKFLVLKCNKIIF